MEGLLSAATASADASSKEAAGLRRELEVAVARADAAEGQIAAAKAGAAAASTAAETAAAAQATAEAQVKLLEDEALRVAQEQFGTEREHQRLLVEAEGAYLL